MRIFSQVIDLKPLVTKRFAAIGIQHFCAANCTIFDFAFARVPFCTTNSATGATYVKTCPLIRIRLLLLLLLLLPLLRLTPPAGSTSYR